MENSNTELKPVLNDFGFFKQVPFIIEGLPKFKVVNYLGYVLNVPKGFKWIALDTDGDIFAYQKKPRSGSSGFWICGEDTECLHMGNISDFVDHISDATVDASLMKIKNLPRIRL